jgi:hypothetical protein
LALCCGVARQKIAPEAADANQHWHHDATAADAAGSAERRGEEGERKNDVVVGFQRQQVLFHHLLPALNFLLSYQDPPRSTNSGEREKFIFRPCTSRKVKGTQCFRNFSISNDLFTKLLLRNQYYTAESSRRTSSNRSATGWS